MLKYLLVIALLALVLPAQAAVLWDQPSYAGADGVASQEFSDDTSYSCRAFDDFTAGPGGWTVQKVTVYGIEWGYGGTPKLAFTSSADCSAIGTTYAGAEVGEDLVFDLGAGVYVAPGNSWITSWVERSSTASQWFWDYITTVNGSQAYWHNPGGGFGLGTTPIPVQNVVGPPARDLAFKIEGRLGCEPQVPEAGALVLAISGIPAMAVFIRRRK